MAFLDGSNLNRLVVDALPAAVFVCEANSGLLVRYNRRAAELWGREPALADPAERFDGAFRLYTPESQPLPHERSPVAEALRTGKPVSDTDLLVERPDGSRITVALRAAPLRDSSGQLRGVVGVFHEVSERRRGEERERLLLQASTVLGSTLDHQAILHELARLTLRRYADWCLIEVVEDDGKVSEVTGAHARPEFEPLVTELASLPSALGDAVAMVLRSGEPYLLATVPAAYVSSVARTTRQLELLRALDPQSLMAVPLKARGRILGVIAFVLSGSGRRYEPADLPLAEGIARRAALAIDNARLYRASQNANRLKDEFLATLSHELRTPLNAVLGWTQLLLTHQLKGDDADRALHTIRRNAEAQAGLISDILDVSSIITGRLRLQVASLDLRSVIDAAVAGIKPAADAKGLVLDIRTDGCPPTMLGDADRLQQILWNLLSNAVKFTPGGGRVTLTVERDGNHVRIQVADTGAGMPASFLPALFERFRQADGSATRSYGGLGLGLAIVRHLTELHGGYVEGESKGEGLGSVFTVTLPVHPSPTHLGSRDVTRQPQGREEPGAVAPRLDGLVALVVDDDPDSRGLVRATLERLGARVRESSSSRDALSALETEWPDVLLADIAMPEQDGYSLIGEVRRIEGRHGRRLAALAITAYARDVDRHRALEAGFDSYLAKPASPVEVAMAVARLTGRPSVARTT